MDQHKPHYATAADWYDAAMQRASLIDAAESAQRYAIAAAHNQQHRITDADTLADQQLYIQGKMPLEEYQRYLQFKHSTPSS